MWRMVSRATLPSSLRRKRAPGSTLPAALLSRWKWYCVFTRFSPDHPLETDPETLSKRFGSYADAVVIRPGGYSPPAAVYHSKKTGRGLVRAGHNQKGTGTKCSGTTTQQEQVYWLW